MIPNGPASNSPNLILAKFQTHTYIENSLVIYLLYIYFVPKDWQQSKHSTVLRVVYQAAALLDDICLAGLEPSEENDNNVWEIFKYTDN